MVEQGSVEIVGVYDGVAEIQCALVEILIYDAAGPPDFSSITQPIDDQPVSDWQVPYDESLLDETGENMLCDLFVRSPAVWPTVARVAFFFRDLQADRPLWTPWGAVPLPQLTPRPARLAFLRYEAP